MDHELQRLIEAGRRMALERDARAKEARRLTGWESDIFTRALQGSVRVLDYRHDHRGLPIVRVKAGSSPA